ncbi:cytochrome P450 71D8-like [Prosopis cineraria]|uniref:cytochrome P450 71D8-like n=1 Tax=Prosopis cineraria TaxID=364024 RepID=UPI0024102900|nr:cytochrome P450 71D8-like [Prosopis cineraria]
MEFQFSFLLLIPFLLLFLILLLRLAKPKDKAKKTQIPGPWKLPILGNLHQLASHSLPHHALRELSLKHGPFMHLQLGEISAVIISSPDLAKEIMKTHDLAFVQRPQTFSAQILSYGATDIAFAPYGDYWRQMRKICTLELLSAKKVQSFSCIRQDEVSKLIESIQSSVGSVFDLTSKVYSLTSSIVRRVAFGDEREYGEELVQLLHTALEQLARFQFADLFPSMKLVHLMIGMDAKLVKIHKKFDKVLEDILQENQKKYMRAEAGQSALGEENLVQVLLRIQHSESLDIPITTDNIKAVISDMFSGGTDTSATVLEWAMSEMMRNPKVMNKAQAEVRNACRGKKVIGDSDMIQLSYLKSVIKETLRLHPPVPLLVPRECRETCQINGYEIPIKTQVIINAWALGRDPNYWYDAERFIPERFQGNSDIDFRGTNFEYIPFGAGRRMCPGISFGLASIELPLASLLYHFDWELTNGMKPEDLDMTETFATTARRKNNLCLIPTPYIDPLLGISK